MADDDYGTEIPLDIDEANRQLDQSEKNDPGTSQANTDAPGSDAGGEMHKDSTDTTPEIPDDTDPGKSDPYGNPTPMTPEEKMKHTLDQYRKSQDSIDKLQSRTQPMWEKYRAMLQQDQNAATQEPQDQAPPPMPSKQKQDWLGSVTQLLAVAIPIAMMFGIRGNGFAKGAMMSAIGSFMKNYSQGRDKAAKEDYQEWKEQASAIHQSNQERHQLYKDTLANKRLALDDQFKLIHSYSQQFLDPTMMKASRTNDMKAVIKHLENQEKADKRFVKGVDKTAKVLHPRDWQDYRQYIKDKTQDKVDPDTDPEGANRIERYTDWKSQEETTADKTRKHKEEETKPPGPSPEDTRKTLFGDE